jgi:hypothetical protein
MKPTIFFAMLILRGFERTLFSGLPKSDEQKCNPTFVRLKCEKGPAEPVPFSG